MFGVKLAGPMVSCVAAATTYPLWIISTGRKAAVVKLKVFNHTAGNIELQLGYDTLAGVWTPVTPDFFCLAGMDSAWLENELLRRGNTPEGFIADVTALTGFAGIIACRVSAAGAAPADVEAQVEVEEL